MLAWLPKIPYFIAWEPTKPIQASTKIYLLANVKSLLPLPELLSFLPLPHPLSPVLASMELVQMENSEVLVIAMLAIGVPFVSFSAIALMLAFVTLFLEIVPVQELFVVPIVEPLATADLTVFAIREHVSASVQPITMVLIAVGYTLAPPTEDRTQLRIQLRTLVDNQIIHMICCC